MYVVFLKYIFVENFNTPSRSHQPIPWNCDDKILEAEGPRAKGREKQISFDLKNLNRDQIFEILWNFEVLVNI